MKRFHVHVSVKDIAGSVRFYSKLFATEPVVIKADYAKWMLDDPRINFAISSRDGKPGLNHLGFQVDSDAELAELREQAARADIAAVDEPGAACCYARSDKYWIEDPQGIAWETFHSLGTIPVFGHVAAEAQPGASACCSPSAKPAAVEPDAAGCCSPKTASVPAKSPAGGCC